MRRYGARLTTGVSIAVLLVAREAIAREAASVDDDADLSEIEDEALGTRGLLRTRAEAVSFDAKERSLELSGNVRIDASPFHLRSAHIKLSRTRWGIEAEGQGRLAFCPCLGTPVTIEFEKAIVAPPGELILKDPKLEIYGVPVMYLPWFWLRSDEKVGVLFPDLAYRGQDGFYLGEGIHLPWKSRGTRQSLDLRGGAYLDGGFVADVRLRSPTATTKIRYDRLVGARAPALLDTSSNADRRADDGLLVDARGSSTGHDVTVAWDVDVVRGRRGVAATTDLDAAAKPWDRASATGALRLGPIVAESGVRAVTRRGGDLTAVEASGPFMALRSSGAIASRVTYDATVEGGALRVSGGAASVAAATPPALTPDSVSYGRAEIGSLVATTVGPLSASITARGAANVATEGRRSGSDRAGTARVRAGIPLARAFAAGDDSDERNDPLVHVIEPFVEASVVHAAGTSILGSLPGRGLASLSGTVPLTDVGLASTLGRWSRREAVELVMTAGAAYGSNATAADTRLIARGRLSATLAWLGAQVETGHAAGDGFVPGGNAAIARVRVGTSEGPRVLGNVAARDGVDPVLARALTEATLESPGGFLAREGTTGGAGLVVPWGRALTTSVGADGDATHQELVAVRGGIELRDRCNCVTLRANGAHRIGRNGVDVWVALDFATDR